MKCPVCHGKGKIEDPVDRDLKHDETQLRAYAVNVLVDKGYSIRTIQKMMGYRSHNSVFYLLKRYPMKPENT